MVLIDWQRYLHNWTNREGLVLTDMLIFKIRFGRERQVTFLYFAHTETAKHNINSCSENNFEKTTTD